MLLEMYIYCYGFLLVNSRRIYACIHESYFGWYDLLDSFVFALNEVGWVGEINALVEW